MRCCYRSHCDPDSVCLFQEPQTIWVTAFDGDEDRCVQSLFTGMDIWPANTDGTCPAPPQ